MSKGSFANEQVMEDYLGALLSEKPQVAVDEVQRQAVARLLEKTKEKPLQQPKVVEQPAPQPAPESAPPSTPVAAVEESATNEPFQALYFQLAGLTLAVPLTELGGIHQLEKPSPLFGKPDWFQGVMLHREEKLSVVDTARWVMPDKMNAQLAESLQYHYLIMLGESHWGLACERLVNTVTLQPDEVKWRLGGGKRPWLAGMVKDKMCALINVPQLIQLLDQGVGSND